MCQVKAVLHWEGLGEPTKTVQLPIWQHSRSRGLVATMHWIGKDWHGLAMWKKGIRIQHNLSVQKQLQATYLMLWRQMECCRMCIAIAGAVHSVDLEALPDSLWDFYSESVHCLIVGSHCHHLQMGCTSESIDPSHSQQSGVCHMRPIS